MPELNIEALTAIKEWLAAGGDPGQAHGRRYALVNWDCGTACCLAGFINLHNRAGTPWAKLPDYDPEHAERLRMATPMIFARRILGLGSYEATRLFTPSDLFRGDFGTTYPYEIHAVHVVRVIDHLINTGKVDWTYHTQSGV